MIKERVNLLAFLIFAFPAFIFLTISLCLLGPANF